MSEFWNLNKPLGDCNKIIAAAKRRCSYSGAKGAVWSVAVEMLVEIKTVFSEELAAARFGLSVEESRMVIRKAVVNTRLLMPEKFQPVYDLDPGISSVLLALVAGDESQSILVEFMGAYPCVTDILTYIYLLDGLTPVRLDTSVGGKDGILGELNDALGVEKTDTLFQNFRDRTLKFPPYKSVLETIEAASCYIISKRMGSRRAADMMEIPEDRVLIHKSRTAAKLKGLNWSFK